MCTYLWLELCAVRVLVSSAYPPGCSWPALSSYGIHTLGLASTLYCISPEIFISIITIIGRTPLYLPAPSFPQALGTQRLVPIHRRRQCFLSPQVPMGPHHPLLLLLLMVVARAKVRGCIWELNGCTCHAHSQHKHDSHFIPTDDEQNLVITF